MIDRRLVEHFEQEDESGSNRMEISGTTTGLFLEITNDWYGDSDSGFGATLHLSLTIAEARRLSMWLGKYLGVVMP
jgi:hypothetical protein